ncbi:chitin synthesis regulation, resistance to congo red-domain-containing protein [Stachybotrys elegans]|uniref:Chitin synthesis regulation, resistance to congo red-domain-containing protein n=1 Tax=Stachybotrys elegans TaxID=80388 RepID=A0A8K0T1L1_9HYPO|nr:chitin synthesis regulation, resistance to congo red-domain-containing protein [Stachybotrys elegans]
MDELHLFPRQGCRYGYHYNGRFCVRNSGWYWWGRWVLAGILIVLIIITLISCSITARRRRRRGLQPYYGTGWMATGQKYDSNNNGYPMNNYQQGGYQPTYPQQQGAYGGGWTNPPPAYGQPQQQYTGTPYNPNEGGYFGNEQQTGVQQPPNSYQPQQVYSPPAGPPPGKA